MNNPALGPPLSKGLKIFAPKKRTLPFVSFRKESRAEALQEAPRKGASLMEVLFDDETSVGLEGELETSLLVWLDRRKGGLTFLVVDVKTRQRSEGT